MLSTKCFRAHCWPKQPRLWLLSVVVSGSLGIAFGNIVKEEFSGYVSVVEGRSMAPNYPPGSRVIASPINTEIERSDVVLIDDRQENYAIKRIIGLPGETVNLWRGRIFINTRMLQEPYLPKYTFTLPDDHTSMETFKLGADEYFVLGDNRSCSMDSRIYGPVRRGQIKSRVQLSPSAPRAQAAPFTLPEAGERMIRPL